MGKIENGHNIEFFFSPQSVSLEPCEKAERLSAMAGSLASVRSNYNIALREELAMHLNSLASLAASGGPVETDVIEKWQTVIDMLHEIDSIKLPDEVGDGKEDVLSIKDRAIEKIFFAIFWGIRDRWEVSDEKLSAALGMADRLRSYLNIVAEHAVYAKKISGGFDPLATESFVRSLIPEHDSYSLLEISSSLAMSAPVNFSLARLIGQGDDDGIKSALLRSQDKIDTGVLLKDDGAIEKQISMINADNLALGLLIEDMRAVGGKGDLSRHNYLYGWTHLLVDLDSSFASWEQEAKTLEHSSAGVLLKELEEARGKLSALEERYIAKSRDGNTDPAWSNFFMSLRGLLGEKEGYNINAFNSADYPVASGHRSFYAGRFSEVKELIEKCDVGGASLTAADRAAVMDLFADSFLVLADGKFIEYFDTRADAPANVVTGLRGILYSVLQENNSHAGLRSRFVRSFFGSTKNILAQTLGGKMIALQEVSSKLSGTNGGRWWPWQKVHDGLSMNYVTSTEAVKKEIGIVRGMLKDLEKVSSLDGLRSASLRASHLDRSNLEAAIGKRELDVAMAEEASKSIAEGIVLLPASFVVAELAVAKCASEAIAGSLTLRGMAVAGVSTLATVPAEYALFGEAPFIYSEETGVSDKPVYVTGLMVLLGAVETLVQKKIPVTAPVKRFFARSAMNVSATYGWNFSNQYVSGALREGDLDPVAAFERTNEGYGLAGNVYIPLTLSLGMFVKESLPAARFMLNKMVNRISRLRQGTEVTPNFAYRDEWSLVALKNVEGQIDQSGSAAPAEISFRRWWEVDEVRITDKGLEAVKIGKKGGREGEERLFMKAVEEEKASGTGINAATRYDFWLLQNGGKGIAIYFAEQMETLTLIPFYGDIGWKTLALSQTKAAALAKKIWPNNPDMWTLRARVDFMPGRSNEVTWLFRTGEEGLEASSVEITGAPEVAKEAPVPFEEMSFEDLIAAEYGQTPVVEELLNPTRPATPVKKAADAARASLPSKELRLIEQERAAVEGNADRPRTDPVVEESPAVVEPDPRARKDTVVVPRGDKK